MDRVELSDGVSSFHFDFHKNISSPKLSCQDSYYASKLTTYAFGIHSGETQQGTVYIWPESVAPKHPDTLLSCLDRHLREVENENRKWCVFWADNTRSQNKNYTLAMYFEHLVSSGAKQRIDYKFFIAGHSFGPVDRNTGRCETIFRNEQTIETPRDYINLINDSVVSSNMQWIEMEQQHFKSYSTWLRTNYTLERKDTNNEPCHFSEMVYMNFGIGERIDPADNIVKTFRHPGVIWMRKTLDPRDPPTILDLRSREQEMNLSRTTLKKLNSKPIKLHEKKRKDLLRLCKYLSPDAKAYYQGIIGNQ